MSRIVELLFLVTLLEVPSLLICCERLTELLPGWSFLQKTENMNAVQVNASDSDDQSNKTIIIQSHYNRLEQKLDQIMLNINRFKEKLLQLVDALAKGLQNMTKAIKVISSQKRKSM